MKTHPGSTSCAGCRLPVSEGTKVVIGLVANDDYSGQAALELGHTSAPCHPEASCIKAAYQSMDPQRHLARAIRAGRAKGHDRLSELLCA